jgi:8-oxo-dGTP pyrophosphatase MutT (NUDIX family)
VLARYPPVFIPLPSVSSKFIDINSIIGLFIRSLALNIIDSTFEKMYVSTATFTLPPKLAPFTASLNGFQESCDSKTRLVIGAFIFSYRQPASEANTDAKLETPKAKPHLLLLHRASADAYGDLWDFPGGSVEESDETMVDAVKREVMEETGLQVTEIVECVGMHTWIEARQGRDIKWAKFSFMVKVAEASDEKDPEIKLAEAEHQAFMWATEEDIRASLEEREGALKFIAMEEIEIAAEAFHRFMDPARGHDL